MVDIARLNIAVAYAGIEDAAKSLERMIGSSKAAERASKGLADESEKASRRIAAEAKKAADEQTKEAKRAAAEAAKQAKAAADEVAKQSKRSADEQAKQAKRAADETARQAKRAADQQANEIKRAASQADREAKSNAARASAEGLKAINAEVKKMEEEAAKLNKPLGLNNAALTNLSFQINDIATSLASGSSPFQVLAQQGGQVFQVFQSSRGGLAPALKQIGGIISSLIPPSRIVMATLAAGGSAAAIAFLQADAALVRVRQSLNGMGALSGLTASGLIGVAQNAAAAGRMSMGQGLEAASSFAQAGLSANQIGTLTSGAGRMQRAFGGDFSEIVAELTKAFQDPARAAQFVSERFASLSIEQREQIDNLRKSGQLEKARDVAIEAFSKGLGQTTEALGVFATLLRDPKNWLSRQWSQVGRGLQRLADPTDQDQIKFNAQQRDDALTVYQRTGNQRWLDRANEFNNKVLALQKKQNDDAEKLQISKAEKERNILQAQAMEAVKALTPEIETRKQLIQQVELLTSAGIKSVQGMTALTRAQTALTTFETPLQRLQTDSETAIKSIMARTLAERIAADSQRAYIQTLRDTKDQTLAMAAAENERARLMAEAARAIRDNGRQVRNETELVGLRPAQADRARISQQYRDLREQYTTAQSGIVPPMFQPFKTGMDSSTASLIKLAEAASRAALGLSGGATPAVGAVAPASVFGDLSGTRAAFAATANSNIPGMQGLQQDFASRLEAMISAIGGITITSGMRSIERQKELFDAAVAKYGSTEAARRWVAPPGGSNHNYGVAADLRFANPQARAEAHRRAGEFGLNFPMGHEPWHVEPVGARAMRAGGAAQPLTVGANPAAQLAAQQAQALKNNETQREIDLLRPLNDQIKAQELLLQRQAETFGLTAGQIAAARKERELLTQAEQQGITVSAALRTKIGETAQQYGRLVDAQQQAAQAMQRFNDIRGSVDGFFSALGSTFLQTRNKSEALKAGLNSLLQSLLRISQNQFMNALFGDRQGAGGLLSRLVGGLAGAAGAAGGPVQLAGAVQSAKGNVFNSGLQRFAQGGTFTNSVVDRPTLFRFARGGALGEMGEAGPEAIMPLRRDPSGRLGVSAAGSGFNNSQRGNTFIHVDNKSSAKASASSRRNGNGDEFINIVINEVASAIGDGRMDSPLRARFGNRPSTVSR